MVWDSFLSQCEQELLSFSSLPAPHEMYSRDGKCPYVKEGYKRGEKGVKICKKYFF